jgi:hypothetical protein
MTQQQQQPPYSAFVSPYASAVPQPQMYNFVTPSPPQQQAFVPFDASRFDAPPKQHVPEPALVDVDTPEPPPPQAYEAPPASDAVPLLVPMAVARPWTRGPLLLAKIGERIAHAYPLGVITLVMSTLLCATSFATLHLTNHMPGV